MLINRKLPLTLLLLFCSITIFAQDKKAEADALIKQGTTLHDARKYDEAIAKYDEALKIDPDNMTAMFEKSFSLVSSGKPDQAIPYLEKVSASNSMPNAYDLLGSIYDDKQNFEKATGYYQKGIAAFPAFHMLRYNLSISLIRQKKFKEAEATAIESIKINPRHASSQRAYAMATFAQGNMPASLLGWCSFLLIEPQTPRGTEGMKFVRTILYNGMTTNGKNTTISLTDIGPANLGIKIAVLGSTVGKTGLSPVDSLELQLTSVFKVLNEQKDLLKSPFAVKYLSDYFNALAISGNMPTYAHFITMTTNRDEDKTWLAAHSAEIKTFTNWLGSTKRDLE
jgi:tetratricopeptide (TPR) repeat protein